MPVDHKDVVIGENQYSIGLMSAADGSWIFSTFVKRYRTFQESQPAAVQVQSTGDVPAVPPEVGFAMTAQFLIEQLSREELAEVQKMCLATCGRYSTKTGIPIAMPILFKDGRFAASDLEHDGPTVLELTKQSIAFNIAPFFPAAGSSETQMPAPDSSQPSIQL